MRFNEHEVLSLLRDAAESLDDCAESAGERHTDLYGRIRAFLGRVSVERSVGSPQAHAGPMRLWLLRRVGPTDDWDANVGMVVRASTATRARELAQIEDEPYDEVRGQPGVDRRTWTTPEKSTCEEIGQGPGSEGVILRDFKDG